MDLFTKFDLEQRIFIDYYKHSKKGILNKYLYIKIEKQDDIKMLYNLDSLYINTLQ